MRRFYEELAELLREHSLLVVATIVKVTGSSPRDAGAKMIVLPSGDVVGTLGGGSLEAQVTKDALECLAQRRPALKSYSLSESGLGMECGGACEVYFEPVCPPDRLIVFGGGHVGKAIARWAAAASFAVEVVDDREEHLDPAAYLPGATLVKTDKTFTQGFTPPGPHDFAVVVTREADMDATLAGRHAGVCGYLGVMGSAKKLGFIKKTLAAQGVQDDVLERIRCPMGLDIGADTPDEIAVSVIAEMIAVRSGKR